MLLKDYFSIYLKSTSKTTVGSLPQEGTDNYINWNCFELKLKSNNIPKNFCEIEEMRLKNENHSF